MSYKVEITEKKDPIEQFEASKSSIKDLFSELVNETKGFKYQDKRFYRPLSGSSYVELPVELKSPKKVLMNVQNNDQKCFSWCHVTHINPVEIHPEKITERDKKHANDLDYDEIKLSVQKEDFSQIEK